MGGAVSSVSGDCLTGLEEDLEGELDAEEAPWRLFEVKAEVIAGGWPALPSPGHLSAILALEVST